MYDQVLLLHTQALLRVLGRKAADRESPILNGLLFRERAYWKRLARARGLDLTFLAAIEQACHAITLNGGAQSVADAIEICRQESLLADLPQVVVHGIAELLRECYPAEDFGIAPLQPDSSGSTIDRLRCEKYAPTVNNEADSLILHVGD